MREFQVNRNDEAYLLNTSSLYLFDGSVAGVLFFPAVFLCCFQQG